MSVDDPKNAEEARAQAKASNKDASNGPGARLAAMCLRKSGHRLGPANKWGWAKCRKCPHMEKVG